uniref:IQ motif containing N n=1 Tax=Loxodonta africana TaxID=9785 RepID=G3TP18_LOXAF
ATPTGRVNPPRNQDNAASNTATAPRPDTTQQAELPPAPARPLSLMEAEAQPSKPQHEATLSQQALEQQVAEEKLEPRRVPRLRTVVESQAFKNVLVDEMDMMMSRAATLIQASWRGHRLRQKLVSQMMAAKAIQEAWRRFNAKRILRSSKGPEKKVEEDKDIPYHPPQQVRFQQLLPEGQKPLPQGLPQPVMASKETQFPSVDSLVTCTPQQATQKLPEALGSLKPSIATSYVLGAPSVAFLPHQTIALRFPCPMHVDTKYQQPCLLTKTIRSSCLVHIEGETVKGRHVATRPSKAGTSELVLSGRCAQVGSGPLKTQTQVHAEAEAPKPSPQVCSVPAMAKTLPQTHTAVSTAKIPSQTCPAAAVAKIPPQTRTVLMTTKIPPQAWLMSPVTQTSSQTRPAATVAYVSPQTHPAATTTKTPPQTYLTGTTTKTPPQTRSMAAMAKIPSQTCPVAKTPPQARLAAMITRTPAQIRSVATLLKTFCLPPAATGNLKVPPQAGIASGIPKSLSQTHLNTAKVKATFTEKQVDTTFEVSSHSYMAVGKSRCPPQEVGAPKAPARPHWEAEKIKVCPQRQMKMEVVSKTSMDMGVEDRSKTREQAQGKKEALRVQPQACVPVEVVTTPCQAQPATTLTKTQCQAHLPTGLAKTLSKTLSKTLYQAQLMVGLSKGQCQAQTPARLSKAQSQTQQVDKMTKAQFQAHIPAGLPKTQSQAQQAWLATETAKPLCPAHQAADLSKTESQPQLATAQSCQHLCTLGLLPHAKPDDRLTQLPAPSLALGKATQVPRLPGPDTQGMLVPLLAGHPSCNIESWGDGRAARAPSPTHSHPVLCPEEATTSQLASLCAELATVLGSQEDLRLLLCKALSQGEVRAALTQVLSKEVLGATVAKALPQGMLGTALAKALSWSELGVAMSRALSRAELRAELARAVQGRLADVLSKALTEDERAALSQALCQGELGAVLNTSLSQATLQTSAMLPSAAAKPAGSSLTVGPGAVEVDCRGTPSAVWRPTLRPMRVHPSKGLTDTGVAGGQPWNAAGPGSMWQPARGMGSWDATATDSRRSGELLLSVHTVEELIIHAVVIIQAHVRGYLVRHMIKVWHRSATIIQALWRGHVVRKQLYRLHAAAQTIQAQWRGYHTRRDRCQQMLQPATWGMLGDWSRTSSGHRCFQSCQPRSCALCQTLCPGLGGPPSVVLLVGSSPRTCHMCGQTMPTRVVQGTGQGAGGQEGVPSQRGHGAQLAPCSPQLPHHHHKAATAIQSAWRGFLTRRHLRKQQVAAKRVQASWRGHFTRTCLTADALLGPRMAWDSPRHAQWPGV